MTGNGNGSNGGGRSYQYRDQAPPIPDDPDHPPKTRKPTKVDFRKEARQLALSGMSPLAYLVRVYRDSKTPKQLRIQAATAALPYVHHRLPQLVGVFPAGAQNLIPPFIPGLEARDTLLDAEGNVLPEEQVMAEMLGRVEIVTPKKNGKDSE